MCGIIPTSGPLGPFPPLVARSCARVPTGITFMETTSGFRQKVGFVKLPRRAVSVCALAGGLALVTSSTAVAAITPVLITGPSPYAACSQFANWLTGRTYLNAEVEPQAAVHGSTAIAMWHQDRRSNGGAHGIGVGYSTDGGASWTQTTITLPASSLDTQHANSNSLRPRDPGVSFGPHGIA